MIDLMGWSNASFVIKVHLGFAVLGFLVGTAVMLARRGTVLHRWCGRVFAGAAMLTALSSFFIHEINQWGPWSWIHLLSVYVVVSTVIGVRAIRLGNVKLHMQTMIPIYLGGFVVAGAFALMPGRLVFEAILMPRLVQVFSGHSELVALAVWGIPALAVILVVLVWWNALVLPLRRMARR